MKDVETQNIIKVEDSEPVSSTISTMCDERASEAMDT